MEIKSIVIETLHYSELSASEDILISNVIINKIDFFSFEPDVKIIIENSIINELIIHGCWFKGGLIFRGNHVAKYINYEMGGHNSVPMEFSCNIFQDFFNFFDCWFMDRIVLSNNIFVMGSNLFGNTDTGWKNTFDKEPIIINNNGTLDFDGVGIKKNVPS
jgi:hypothetical protein